MVKKYYGIWKKDSKSWWPILRQKVKADLRWKRHVEAVKIINGVPIWDNLDKINRLVRCWNPSYWEVKEFTPQDALLERCRKHG